MFISTADVREGRQGGGREAVLGEGGGGESAEDCQRKTSRVLTDRERVFSCHSWLHSLRSGKRAGRDRDVENEANFHVVPQIKKTILLVTVDLHCLSQMTVASKAWKPCHVTSYFHQQSIWETLWTGTYFCFNHFLYRSLHIAVFIVNYKHYWPLIC